MAFTPSSPEPDNVSTAAPDEAGLLEPLPDSRLVRAVIAAAAHGPSSRPMAVLLIAVAVEAVFLAALGAVQQTRHILAIPGSLMALTAVVAGAMGGPIVGSVVVLVGAAPSTTPRSPALGSGARRCRRWSPQLSGSPPY